MYVLSSSNEVKNTFVIVEGVNADLKFRTYNDNKFIGKADRLLVEDAIGAPGSEVELEVTGQLIDGTQFKGTAIIEAHQDQ